MSAEIRKAARGLDLVAFHIRLDMTEDGKPPILAIPQLENLDAAKRALTGFGLKYGVDVMPADGNVEPE